ncbi:MAG: hypothetical protein Q9166_007744 [cf. Caloplaca sp. 2 TL-2023]
MVDATQTRRDLIVAQHTYHDLRNVVQVVVANANQKVAQNYFDPNDAAGVANVFTTVLDRLAPRGVQNAPNQGLRPTDAQEIRIRRTNDGCGTFVLAYSDAVATSTNLRLGRLRQDTTCD